MAGSQRREAVDLYREHREDIVVVLLDVCMPGLDGLQTLEVLRGLNHEVQACFMSGDTDPYKPEELIQCGAAYVIAKPFLLDDLANILRLMAQGVPAALLPSGGDGKGEPGKKPHRGDDDANDPCGRG